MYSESRFCEIEEQLEKESRDFDGSSSNDTKAQTLLITAVELNRVHRQREREFDDVIEARHQYQVIFSLKGVQALFALYQLVKHYRYDSAYRNLRFLYETYFVIRGLNKNKNVAEKIALEHLDELRALDDNVRTAEHEPESVDKLFGIMRDEKSKAEQADDGLGELFNYLSNRSIHPVRMDGAALDGSHNEEEEEQILTFALYLAFGLTKELFGTYLDTPASEMIRRESQPIVRRFNEVLDGDVPIFLTDEY